MTEVAEPQGSILLFTFEQIGSELGDETGCCGYSCVICTVDMEEITFAMTSLKCTKNSS